jgi:hypothetical protein
MTTMSTDYEEYDELFKLVEQASAFMSLTHCRQKRLQRRDIGWLHQMVVEASCPRAIATELNRTRSNNSQINGLDASRSQRFALISRDSCEFLLQARHVLI